ncbi:MAG: hypothetical protein ACFBSF_21215 [Leptolyngbyaceae cyanobacterium]
MSRNSLRSTEYGEFIFNDHQRDIARIHTLIALRRLIISDEKSIVNENVLNSLFSNFRQFSDEDKLKADNGNESENYAGQLKGLLIRYLYNAELIGYGFSYTAKPAVVSLSGADITNVVIEDEWLSRINLNNA